MNDEANLAAVEAATKAVEAATSNGSDKNPPANVVEQAPELGKLGAEAIEKFTEAAAVHIESVGQELLTLAQQHDENCKVLAKEMREAAKVMAAQTIEFTNKIKQAGLDMKAIRSRFDLQQAQ